MRVLKCLINMNLIQLNFKQHLLAIVFLYSAVFAYGQNNLTPIEGKLNLIGKIPLLQDEISLSQNQNAAKGEKKYRFNYPNQDNFAQKSMKAIDFYASQEKFEALFNQIKNVFKSKVTTEINLDQNIQLHLQMISTSDIQFTLYKNNSKEGVFSVSATGLHLLFGKEWSKSAWRNYLAE